MGGWRRLKGLAGVFYLGCFCLTGVKLLVQATGLMAWALRRLQCTQCFVSPSRLAAAISQDLCIHKAASTLPARTAGGVQDTLQPRHGVGCVVLAVAMASKRRCQHMANDARWQTSGGR
jgi:hypothetical protein